MLLDPNGCFGKEQDLGIGNAELMLLRDRHGPNEGSVAAAALAVDHADLLLAETAPQHAAKALRQGRLVDVELVGIDTALDDGLAKAVTPRHEDHVRKSRFRVEREHHSAGRKIGPDHLHHGDGQGDLEVIKAVVDPVGDRAIGENGGKAAPAGLEQILRATYIEEALMLAGKTRGRQIFRRRGAAHRDSDAGSKFPFKLPIGFRDLVAQRGAVHRGIDDVARLGGPGRELPDVALVETVEQPMQCVRDARLR